MFRRKPLFARIFEAKVCALFIKTGKIISNHILYLGAESFLMVCNMIDIATMIFSR